MKGLYYNRLEKSEACSNHRYTSIELLRIIAMLMIVFHHFSVHGGFQYVSGHLDIPRLWVMFISMGGKIGVDIFVLISGYFLVFNSQFVNLKHMFRLWGVLSFTPLA